MKIHCSEMYSPSKYLGMKSKMHQKQAKEGQDKDKTQTCAI